MSEAVCTNGHPMPSAASKCECGARIQMQWMSTTTQSSTDDSKGLSNRWVSTLAEIPGHPVVAHHGVVTAVASANFKGAQTKGSNALDDALGRVRTEAFSLGANAIVGLQVSSFGAKVIGAGSGDAVGVVVTGTAVTVTRQATAND